MSDKKVIYTLGYTLFQTNIGFDIDLMFRTLEFYKVSYLVDVRSVPYSKQYPHCNADNLKAYGKRYSIPYIHMPELGAKADGSQDVFSKASDIFFEDIFPISKSNRPEKTELKSYEEIVDFNKFRGSEYFLDGIKRVETAYDKNFTLALMCSEKKPMDCHRFFLISKKLQEKFGDWLQVEHIIKNKSDQIYTLSNQEVQHEMIETVLNKSDIKKLDILSSSFLEPAIIDNYYGETLEQKLLDFCDRYWNLLHGWKKNNNSNNIEDYD